MPAQYQQGSQERSGALEAMYNTVKKKLRDGPGPNSYKRDDDILDEYYNNGHGGEGSLSGSLGAAGSLGGGMGVLSENFDAELFEGKDDGASSSIFGMDDVGLSSSFKDTMTIHEHASEPAIMSPFAAPTSHPAPAPAGPKSRKVPIIATIGLQTGFCVLVSCCLPLCCVLLSLACLCPCVLLSASLCLPRDVCVRAHIGCAIARTADRHACEQSAGGGAATSAAAALAGAKGDSEMGPPRAVPPSSRPAPSAAAMMGGLCVCVCVCVVDRGYLAGTSQRRQRRGDEVEQGEEQRVRATHLRQSKRLSAPAKVLSLETHSQKVSGLVQLLH
jgi:hypothetical protein